MTKLLINATAGYTEFASFVPLGTASTILQTTDSLGGSGNANSADGLTSSAENREQVQTDGEPVVGDSGFQSIAVEQPTPPQIVDYWPYAILALIPLVWFFSALFRKRDPSFKSPKKQRPKVVDPEKAVKGRFKKTERFQKSGDEPQNLARSSNASMDSSSAPSKTASLDLRPPTDVLADSLEPADDVSSHSNSVETHPMKNDLPADEEFEFDLENDPSDSDMFEEADEINQVVMDSKKTVGSSKRFKTEEDVAEGEFSINEDEFASFDDQDSQLSLADSDADFGFDIDDDDDDLMFDDEKETSQITDQPQAEVSEPLSADVSRQSDDQLAETNAVASEALGATVDSAGVQTQELGDLSLVTDELAGANPVEPVETAAKGSLLSRMFGRGKKKDKIEPADERSAVDQSVADEATLFSNDVDPPAELGHAPNILEGTHDNVQLADEEDLDFDFLEDDDSSLESDIPAAAIETSMQEADETDSGIVDFDFELDGNKTITAADSDTLDAVSDSAWPDLAAGLVAGASAVGVAASNKDSTDTSELVKENERLVAEIASMNQKLESSRADQDAARDLVSQANDEIQQLKTQLADQMTSKESHAEEVEGLKEKIDALTSDLETANKQLAAQEEETNSQQQALADKQKVYSEEQSKLSEENLTLKTELESVQKQLQELTDKSNSEKDSVDKVTAEKEKLEAELSKANADQQALQDERDRIKDELDSLGQANQKTTAETEEKISELVAENTRLTEEQAKFTDLRSDWDQQRAKLEAEIQSLKQQAERSESVSTPAETNGEDVEDLRSRFKMRLAQEHRKRKSAEAQVAEAENQRNQVAKTLKALKAELEGLKTNQNDDLEFAD